MKIAKMLGAEQVVNDVVEGEETSNSEQRPRPRRSRKLPRLTEVIDNAVTKTLFLPCLAFTEGCVNGFEKIVEDYDLEEEEWQERREYLERQSREREIERRRRRNSDFTGIMYFDDPEGLNQNMGNLSIGSSEDVVDSPRSDGQIYEVGSSSRSGHGSMQ